MGFEWVRLGREDIFLFNLLLERKEELNMNHKKLLVLLVNTTANVF